MAVGLAVIEAVVAPVLQVIEPEHSVTESVTSSPEHMLVEDAVINGDWPAPTSIVTVPEASLVHVPTEHVAE